jgi:hypothetical protein
MFGLKINISTIIISLQAGKGKIILAAERLQVETQQITKNCKHGYWE